MKKHNLLVALVMTMVMLFTGCGSSVTEDDFVGKWTGTLDYSEHFEKMMISQNADLEKYAKFEGLTLTFVFEFTKDEVSLKLDETSSQQFVANAEKGIVAMIDAMAADEAAAIDVTADDIFAGMNTTRDAYVQSVMASMQFDAMISEMAKALELNGKFYVDGDVLVVTYEDGTYEKMGYNFGKEDLTITISDGVSEFAINCQKAK